MDADRLPGLDPKQPKALSPNNNKCMHLLTTPRLEGAAIAEQRPMLCRLPADRPRVIARVSRKTIHGDD